MRNLWSACLGAAVVAIPATYFLLQNDSPTSSIAEQQVEPARVAEQNVDQAARMLELETRLSDMQARLDRADAAGTTARQAAQTQSPHAVNETSPLPSDVHSMEQKSNIEAAADDFAASREQLEIADKNYQQRAVAALENKLADEQHDAEWAGNFQSGLEQGLAAESFKVTRLTNVDCKTSVCRVTLGHDSQEHEEQFFEHVLELPVMANTQAYYTRVPNADGSSSTVMYIAREGQSLPLPTRSGQNSVN